MASAYAAFDDLCRAYEEETFSAVAMQRMKLQMLVGDLVSAFLAGIPDPERANLRGALVRSIREDTLSLRARSELASAVGLSEFVFAGLGIPSSQSETSTPPEDPPSISTTSGR